jgi:hypothetical protein
MMGHEPPPDEKKAARRPEGRLFWVLIQYQLNSDTVAMELSPKDDRR